MSSWLIKRLLSKARQNRQKELAIQPSSLGLDPISEALFTLRTEKQTVKQPVYQAKGPLYDKARRQVELGNNKLNRIASIVHARKPEVKPSVYVTQGPLYKARKALAHRAFVTAKLNKGSK